ncbi:50S ribosomal protein L18 [Mycobacterium tuberculosis]|nr:50S ribosomal protein L18 [Mycobacterium tuberculosis]
MAQSVSATRRISRLRRHTRLRKKLSGTAERPRLVVHRSARHIHVQLVNDLNGTNRGRRFVDRGRCARRAG